MGLITYFYKKKLVCRYDKQVGIPYYSHLDFSGLNQDKASFTNSKGIEITYFYYYYPNFKNDKIILFCHGIGPGHTAYLKEIEWLAKAGYKVLTLDYTGCGESKGKMLGSLYNPTQDVLDLLNHINLDSKIIVVGHSLGGFTALNVVANLIKCYKAVIMSGFLSVPLLLKCIIKNKFFRNSILRYECHFENQFTEDGIFNFLNNTKKELLFIQSTDDNIVPYEASLKPVEEVDNKNIKTLKVYGKKHNPNYSLEAVEYMEETFKVYHSKLKGKMIKTDEEKINFFKNVSLDKLTEQDPKIIREIINFIEK